MQYYLLYIKFPFARIGLVLFKAFFHAIGDAIVYIFLVKILSFLDVFKSVRQEMFTLGKSSCYHVAKKWAFS